MSEGDDEGHALDGDGSYAPETRFRHPCPSRARRDDGRVPVREREYGEYYQHSSWTAHVSPRFLLSASPSSASPRFLLGLVEAETLVLASFGTSSRWCVVLRVRDIATGARADARRDVARRAGRRSGGRRRARAGRHRGVHSRAVPRRVGRAPDCSDGRGDEPRAVESSRRAPRVPRVHVPRAPADAPRPDPGPAPRAPPRARRAPRLRRRRLGDSPCARPRRGRPRRLRLRPLGDVAPRPRRARARPGPRRPPRRAS